MSQVYKNQLYWVFALDYDEDELHLVYIYHCVICLVVQRKLLQHLRNAIVDQFLKPGRVKKGAYNLNYILLMALDSRCKLIRNNWINVIWEKNIKRMMVNKDVSLM